METLTLVTELNENTARPVVTPRWKFIVVASDSGEYANEAFFFETADA